MPDPFEAAERIIACEICEGGCHKDAIIVARTLLALRPSAEVKAAMERLRKYYANKHPYRDGRQAFDDQMIVSDAYLTAIGSER